MRRRARRGAQAGGVKTARHLSTETFETLAITSGQDIGAASGVRCVRGVWCQDSIGALLRAVRAA
jgi:hypothetical protein